MNRSGLAALAVLLTSCGGPLLYAEVEIPELRITLARQSVPAFDLGVPSNWCDPSAPPPPIPCVGLSTGYDLGAEVPALAERGVTSELRLTQLALTLSPTQAAPGAPTDLGGIRSAEIWVGAQPGVPGSGTLVASYSRPTAGTPTVIAVSGNANVDLSPYVASGRLPFRVELTVDGPTSAFDADVRADFYVRVKLDWGKYL